MNRFLPLLLAAVPLSAQEGDVLVRVNGAPIFRQEAVDRAWKRHGTAVVNEMADELLVAQAAAELKLKADPKEVKARMDRIRAQFPDEATFKARLEASGGSAEQLRAQLEAQVLREALVTKAKDLKVTDAEVKEAFEQNKDKLGAREAVRARHLVVAGEKEASDFLVAIRAGADFAKLAAQVSLDAATKERGGDLGWVSRGLAAPQVEELLFGLKAGEVGGPLKTQAGFHLFKVDEVRAAKAAVLKDVKADLKAALFADKLARAWPAYLEELRAKAAYEPVSGR